ncbi:SDR family NAD(P)-dependent oxidoreductase [Jiulongibacter sediminis]|uniref:Short-chain dehydrogenase n=1 Tax=Jiulongibacter sediminis TaxID=1605367 RepID=A0A0P7C074_9BACT|nr:SDR family oxidoreductase [Jiulongibacter sediminis]KPM47939.1 short-chain dehydrogenase [Jiulongibacter sediminis]TBX24122.1 short-chain dehydrogenase [Jiulongibacter sediminis]
MKRKIALVTGGSRGLGKEMAIRLAEKGLDVILTYQGNKDLAKETVKSVQEKGARSVALKLDLTDLSGLSAFTGEVKESLESTFENPGFDYLIHNAGMGGTIPFETATEDQFDAFMNTHYKGVYFLTQKLLPLMNNDGGIVTLSSGTTRFVNPGYSIYASMKGAVETLTKYFAKELGHRGIKPNVVAPGPIETDFNNAAIRNNPQLKERLSGMSPLGRVGVAEDIGGVVAFLCSEDARWINGQRIEVSGGINV